MTVFLRALYGPFGPDTNQSEQWDWSTGQPVLRYRGPVTEIDWHFFGIRENNTIGRWTLRLKLSERKYLAFADSSVNQPAAAGYENAFVPDKPMVYGPTYLAILKPRLSKEDIDLASRLAIEAARR